MKKNTKKDKEEKEIQEDSMEILDSGTSEIEHLRKLYQELLDRNIRSIGDLENQIARLQK